jgi:hypothetical protein
MNAAWSAEEALARHTGGRLRVPDLFSRQYLFRQNRIARWIRKGSPGFGQDALLFDFGREVVIFLMWCDKMVSEVLKSPGRRKWLYIFDSWEPDWNAVEVFLQSATNVGAVFFSSSQAAAHFDAILEVPVLWCPQAADPKEFNSVSGSAERLPQILNIGRANRTLGEFFRGFSGRSGLALLSQNETMDILFPDRASFVQALGRSRIVVVHPRDMDAPEQTGSVSMLTARYFEAFMSGAVVCGFKPRSGEFEQVFREYPFVEYRDPGSFERDLLEELGRPERWASARERALEEHSWDARARLIAVQIANVIGRSH